MAQEQSGAQRGTTAAASAAKKLDELFVKLNAQEQEVVAQIVRAALIQAAEGVGGKQASAAAVPDFVTGITGQHAPALVKSLRFPGSLAAHSIPGCNAAALEILRKETGTARG